MNHPFSDTDILEIEESIRKAELHTSGEIRVHLEANADMDVLDRAAEVFDELHMQKTALRNGVLFYIAYAEREFAILGDVGINRCVPSTFWDQIRDLLQLHFKKEEYTKGLCTAIELAGTSLASFFPYQRDDINELSNHVSFGKSI